MSGWEHIRISCAGGILGMSAYGLLFSPPPSVGGIFALPSMVFTSIILAGVFGGDQ